MACTQTASLPPASSRRCSLRRWSGRTGCAAPWLLLAGFRLALPPPRPPPPRPPPPRPRRGRAGGEHAEEPAGAGERDARAMGDYDDVSFLGGLLDDPHDQRLVAGSCRRQHRGRRPALRVDGHAAYRLQDAGDQARRVLRLGDGLRGHARLLGGLDYDLFVRVAEPELLRYRPAHLLTTRAQAPRDADDPGRHRRSALRYC